MSPEQLQQSLAVIASFQACLNRPDMLPEMAFRRNASVYTLVSYVNHITGLFLSSHYEPIATFFSRASKHMAEVPPGKPADQAYYALVTRYMTHMAWHLQDTEQWSMTLGPESVPEGILTGGSQPPPEMAARPLI